MILTDKDHISLRVRFFMTLALLFIGVYLFSQEICNNDIDDDGDGNIDLNDFGDCYCGFMGGINIPPVPFPSGKGCIGMYSTYSFYFLSLVVQFLSVCVVLGRQ